MTVTTTTVAKAYAGTGDPGTVFVFAIDFQFWDAEEIDVYIRTTSTGVLSAKKDITTDYSITGGAGAQGTLTMVVAPTNLETLHIIRLSDQDQLVDLTPATDFPVASVEEIADRQALRLQEARDAGETRSMLIPLTDMDTAGDLPDMSLPDKAVRSAGGVGGTSLGFDLDGKPTILTGTLLATSATATVDGKALVESANFAAMRGSNILDVIQNGLANAVDTFDADLRINRQGPGAFGKGFLYATDDRTLYYSDGSAWVEFPIAKFANSAIPAAADAGRLYIDTDNKELLYDDTGDTGNNVPMQSPWIQGSIGGLKLTRGGATKITVAAGEARAILGVTGSRNITFGGMSKDLGAVDTWVQGNNQLGMADTVDLAVNKWFFVFLIAHADGTSDIAIDDNEAGSNIAAGLIATANFDEHFRYIGAFRTDGTASGEIIDFVQDGDHFRWVVPVNSFVDAGDRDYTDPGISIPLSHSPASMRTELFIDTMNLGVANALVVFTETATTSAAPVINTAPGYHLAVVINKLAQHHIQIRTDASRQIRCRSTLDAAFQIQIITRGWWDRRGKDS